MLYSPTSELVILGGIILGPSTNNLAEYHVVIELLTKALPNDLREIRVYLDYELVVQQLNWVYTVRKPLLLRTFRRFRLLEISFDQVVYQHVPRHLNVVEDSLANYVLNWRIAHV